MAKARQSLSVMLLRPLYRALWTRPERRVRKLLQFANVEADGGRDLVRASETTRDPVLRRLFLHHAGDEARHAEMFRTRGLALRATLPPRNRRIVAPGEAVPGEHGLDDLRVEAEPDGALLAFIHLAESAAAREFTLHSSALEHDEDTRAVFDNILRDEEFHMRYSRAQLDRLASGQQRFLLWKARLRRLWKAYLRLATGLAGIMATIILTAQYFIILPPFALLAKRAARRQRDGWVVVPPAADRAAPGTAQP